MRIGSARNLPPEAEMFPATPCRTIPHTPLPQADAASPCRRICFFSLAFMITCEDRYVNWSFRKFIRRRAKSDVFEKYLLYLPPFIDCFKCRTHKKKQKIPEKEIFGLQKRNHAVNYFLAFA